MRRFVSDQGAASGHELCQQLNPELDNIEKIQVRPSKRRCLRARSRFESLPLCLSGGPRTDGERAAEPEATNQGDAAAERARGTDVAGRHGQPQH